MGISIPMAILGAGVIGGGAQIAGAAIGGNAASSAAKTAANTQLDMFNQTQANLAPYISAGNSAESALQPLIGTNAGGNPLTAALTAPFQPTMAQLSQTPGYQFTLGQGLEATQNSYAAQGLGSSGAAMKGGIQYAEGLAGTTYQQQFQNYLTQNAQIYNMLTGQAQMGANAAAGLGQTSAQVGANVGSDLVSAGNATANAASSVGNSIAGVANNASNAYLLNSYLGGGGAGIAPTAAAPLQLASAGANWNPTFDLTQVGA